MKRFTYDSEFSIRLLLFHILTTQGTKKTVCNGIKVF